MSVEFDVDRLYGNISKLMKDQGIKPSEMEGVMDVSAGYLSKLVKNKTVLGADILFRIAQRLGVSVDLLINCDLTVDRATDNLRLMTRFLQKLRADTDATTLRWKSTNADSMDIDYMLSTDEPYVFTQIEAHNNPLFGEVGYYLNDYGTTKIDMIGQSFYADMTTGRIYVSHLVETIPDGEHVGEQISYYAVDSYVSGEISPVCSSKGHTELYAELELLYECLKRHAADLQISEPVRNFIDAYVNPPKPTLGGISAAIQRGLIGE